jgi:hypothetical protein
MKRTFIFSTIFFVIFLYFVSDILLAQPIPLENLRWNQDTRPSFLKDDKQVTYDDFLPRFPTKEECERYKLDVDDSYRDDSLTILSLFVEPKYIPGDLKKNLIAFRTPLNKPILFLPDLMTRTNSPVREGLIACWGANELSFFYIDTLTSIVLIAQKNPTSHWSGSSEYTEVSVLFRPDFTEMIQDHSLVEEELFARKPLIVASLRRRVITTSELEKKIPWGLSNHATFFCNASNNITVFRCDKLLDKNNDFKPFSRFSLEAKQDRLLTIEREVIFPQNRAAAPSPAQPPAKGTEEEILAQLAKYHRELEAAEARTRELVKIESERLKMIAAFANVTKEEQQKISGILWWEVYVKDWQNNIDQSPAEFSALQNLLSHNDADCRNFAICMLYSTNPKVVQKIYLETFTNEKNIKNKKSLIELLVWKGDEECIPFLETIYSDKKNPPIIRHVAWKTQNFLEAKYKNKMSDTALPATTDSNKQEKNKSNKK